MTIKEKILKEIENLSPQQLDRAYKIIRDIREDKKNAKTTLTFDWAGGLRELKDKFTSVELQHDINELR